MEGLVAPLGLVAEVVVVALVAEEKVLVTPERRGQLRSCDDCTDELLFTPEALWHVHGVDKVQHGALLDHLKSVEDAHFVILIVV